jgi:hypothetical protein
MKPESKRPIQIEDLLRLKRAERPPAEFWTEFDRQLRAKQLAAIVAKRPWWQRVPNLFTGFTRYHLPLGAAAVLAVTFITLREPRSKGAPESEVPPVRQRATASVESHAPVAFASTTRAEHAATLPATPVLEQAKPAAGTVEFTAAASLTSEATNPGELSQIIPLLGASTGEPLKGSVAANTEYVPTAFGAPVPAEPVLARGLLTNASLDGRTALRPAIEPLQQIMPPGERGRTKILTAMVKPVVETRARTSDEIGSRLPEDRLYEQVRRFGARGAGLNIKL